MVGISPKVSELIDRQANGVPSRLSENLQALEDYNEFSAQILCCH